MKKTNFVYSAKDNAIYPVELKPSYVDAGTWPSDGVPITDEMASEFSERPADKFMVAGEDGLPAWKMEPPVTQEQLIDQANDKRRVLMSEASMNIETLQDAVDFGMATASDEEKLKSWRKYRVLLSKLDTSKAPDIEWPAKPE